MDKKNKLVVSITGIVLVLLILVGLTYGYYLTRISGNTSDKSISIDMANLELTYSDGNGLIEAKSIIPGETIATKTFTVKNTGNAKVSNYVVYLDSVVNNFKDKNDLKLTLTCTSDIGNCNGTNITYPSTNTMLVTNDIEEKETQSYELKVEFIETNDDQSDNMNKEMSGNILIKDIKGLNNTLDNIKGTNNLVVENGKLLSNYKIYGNSVQTRLPSEYQEVEYIESDGTGQSITLKKQTFSPKVKLEYVAQHTTSNSNQKVFSHGGVANKNNFTMWEYNDGYYFSVFGNENQISNKSTLEKHKIVVERTNTTTSNIYINDVLEKTYTGIMQQIESTTTLFSGGSSQFYSGKLYYLKLWLDDVLTYDLIPCYRKSDNVVGMYDMVENVFYTNSGAQNFTVGEIIPSSTNPQQIQSVGDLVTDTTDLNYSKYKIPIKVTGKNLFDINSIVKDKGLAWATGNYYNITGGVASDFIRVNNNTSYVSKYNAQVILYDENYKYISSVSGTNPTKSFKITNEKCKYIKIAFRVSDNYGITDFKNINDIMLEEGTSATEYEPYQEVTYNIYLDEPLRKTDNYSDYIDFKSGKVIRNVKVDDNTGTKTISESFSKLNTQIEEKISLPTINLNSTKNYISIDTSISPSNTELEYIK